MDTLYLDRQNKRTEADLWSASSIMGIVVSSHYRASSAGIEILEQGGNAFDAAVAVSAALGVVEPAASGLGGMTMMNIHLAENEKTFIIEGPCLKPRNATPQIVASHPRKSGYKAVAVPTNPAVLAYTLKNYGTMSSEAVLQPAIQLAEEGYIMSPFQNRLLTSYSGQLKKQNGAAFFLNDKNAAFEAGQRICQPVLSRTLKRLARYGFEEFYLGETGRHILKDMAENGGFLCSDDFNPVPYPIESETLCKTISDWVVHTLPPPGGGYALLEMLSLYDDLISDAFDPGSPFAAVLFASIIQKVRKDRITYRLDLTKGNESIDKMLGEENIQRIAASIRSELTHSGETTHFNVIDHWGNIVACTQSIERSYGAKVATPSLGFLYNGFMQGFKIENIRHPHYLRQGAVARSNASPTLVFTPKKVFAIGSTGSERMASGIFQVLTRLRHQGPFEAVSAPRLHSTPDKQVLYEPERFSNAVLSALRDAGFSLNPYPEPWAFSSGGLQLACREETGQWAVADPRRDGAAFSLRSSRDYRHIPD